MTTVGLGMEAVGDEPSVRLESAEHIYRSARWLKPKTILYERFESEYLQAYATEPWVRRWEVFRELPKPTSWAEAQRIVEQQQPVGWKGIEAEAILNFEDLVSRPYEPRHEDEPRPLRRRIRNETPGQDTISPAVDVFKYDPLLDGRSIRVLDLLPGQGMDRLQFNLRTVPFDSPDTRYEALSYAWGTHAVDFLHNSHLISCPETLYRALLRLRRPNEPRTVWADALCINQNDDQEKSHQVRKMGKIYKKARRVLICLDDDNAHVAGPAFDLARRVKENQLEAIPPPESPIWGAFILLFDKTWFERIWCLQEIVLSSSAEVIWGPATASWEHVGLLAAWICNVGFEVLSEWSGRLQNRYGGSTSYTPGAHRAIQPYNLRNGSTSYNPGIHMASLMYNLWQSSRTVPAERISFFDLICLARSFKATDPRDKVFALIGIPTTEADPECGHCFVEPDYSNTVSDVFMDVAKALITQTYAGINTLAAVQPIAHEERRLFQRGLLMKWPTTYPSWVPDWTRYQSKSLNNANKILGNRQCSESRRLPTVAWTFDQSILTVSGLQVDVIRSRRLIRLGTRGYFSELLGSLSTAWKTIVKRLGIYSSDVSLSEAFCWTISGGSSWQGMRVLPAERAEHIADYEAFRNISGGSSWQGMRVLPAERAEHIADYEAFRNKYCVAKEHFLPAVELVGINHTGDARRFYEAVCYACSNRCLFVTEKGDIGLGPHSMGESRQSVEFQVCFIGGANLPFILRKGNQSRVAREGGSIHSGGSPSSISSMYMSDDDYLDPQAFMSSEVQQTFDKPGQTLDSESSDSRPDTDLRGDDFGDEEELEPQHNHVQAKDRGSHHRKAEEVIVDEAQDSEPLFEVVGECYIYGLVDGEAGRDQTCEDVQSFKLV